MKRFEAQEFDRVRSAASSEFRDAIPVEEMRRVWSELEASVGAVRGVERDVVMHDLALNCERGDAHLQIVYEDSTITGLVLLNGSPTAQLGR